MFCSMYYYCTIRIVACVLYYYYTTSTSMDAGLKYRSVLVENVL